MKIVCLMIKVCFKKCSFPLLLIISFTTVVSKSFASDSLPLGIPHKKTASDSGAPPPKKAKKEYIGGDNEVFYVFDVGQGNSQLAVFLKSKMAVLFDGGSSSQTVYPKHLHTRQDVPNLFIRKIRKIANPMVFPLEASPELLGSESDDLASGDESKSDETIMASQNASAVARQSIDMGNVVAGEYIREKILEHGIKELFIILSHPDKDHINFISEIVNAKLADMAVYFILNGKFKDTDKSKGEYGGKGKDVLAIESEVITEEKTIEEAEKKADKAAIKELNNFIDGFVKERRKSGVPTFVFRPYLWNKRKDLSASYPPYFQGTLLEFLQREAEYEGIEKINDSLDDIKGDLEKVFIWSFNHIASNVNEESAIVSFKMPEIGMTFICTGDAEDGTFGHIYQSMSQEGFEEKYTKYIKNGADNLPVMLMIPHHGSAHNLSNGMIMMFKPAILAISAGSGTQYGHPSNTTISYYRNLYSSNETLQQVVANFMDQFAIRKKSPYLSFSMKSAKIGDDKKKKKVLEVSRRQMYKDGTIPIIATNLVGTIKIDTKGFASQYTSNSRYEYGGEVYNIDTRQSINLADLKSNNSDNKSLKQINELIRQSNPDKSKSAKLLLNFEKEITSLEYSPPETKDKKINYIRGTLPQANPTIIVFVEDSGVKGNNSLILQFTGKPVNEPEYCNFYRGVPSIVLSKTSKLEEATVEEIVLTPIEGEDLYSPLEEKDEGEDVAAAASPITPTVPISSEPT